MANSSVEQEGSCATVPGQSSGPARVIPAQTGQLACRAVQPVQQQHRVVRQLEGRLLGPAHNPHNVGGQAGREDRPSARLRQPLADHSLTAPAVQVAALHRPTQTSHWQRMPANFALFNK